MAFQLNCLLALKQLLLTSLFLDALAMKIAFPLEFHASFYAARYADLQHFTTDQLLEHWRSYGIHEKRNASSIGSRVELLQCLSRMSSILEIGPFDRPSLEVLKPSVPTIHYADYLSTEQLIERAAHLPDRVPESVPPIDYVLSEGYSQIKVCYDAVVSHHCVEHQPDLIRHLDDVRSIIKPGGVYVFTLPDKYLCFDHFIPESTIVDVLAAYYEQRKRPPIQAVIEHICFTRHEYTSYPNPYEYVSAEMRQQIDDAVRHFHQRQYVDVHCWQFTLTSFKSLIGLLVGLGYLPSSTKVIGYSFMNEFGVVLSFGDN